LPASQSSELIDRLSALLDRELDAANMDEFLVAADEVARDIGEAYAALSRAKDEDTANEQAKAAYLEFVTQVLPQVAPLGDEINRKMLAVTDYSPPPELEVSWAAMRDDVDLFVQANVEL